MASRSAVASLASAVRTRYAKRPSSTPLPAAQRRRLRAAWANGSLSLDAAAGVKPLQEHELTHLIVVEPVRLEGIAPLVQRQLIELISRQWAVLEERRDRL